MAIHALRDRETDERPPERLARPNILGRAIESTLLLLAVGFIVYGTGGPLTESGMAWIRSPDRWSWIPPVRGTDAGDLFTNVLVYLPVGLAFRLVARRRGRPPILDFAIALAGTGALSWSTECLQQWMPGRTSSLTDVVLNLAGGAAGAALAPTLLRCLRALHGRLFVAAQANRPRVLAWVVFASLVTASTAPWRLSRPMVDMTPAGSSTAADLERLAFFAIWGGLYAAARLRSMGDGLRAFLTSIAVVVVSAAFIEGVQAVLALHVSSVRDLIVESSGGILGVAVSMRIGALRDRGLRRAASLTIVAAVTIGAGFVLRELALPGVHEPAVDWIPFRAEFNSNCSVALASLLQTGLFFFVLGVLGHEIAGRSARSAVLPALVAGAAACEMIRALVSEHVITPTPLLLAGLAGFAACRVCASLLPRSADSAPTTDAMRRARRASTPVSTQPI